MVMAQIALWRYPGSLYAASLEICSFCNFSNQNMLLLALCGRVAVLGAESVHT